MDTKADSVIGPASCTVPAYSPAGGVLDILEEVWISATKDNAETTAVREQNGIISGPSSVAAPKMFLNPGRGRRMRKKVKNFDAEIPLSNNQKGSTCVIF